MRLGSSLFAWLLAGCGDPTWVPFPFLPGFAPGRTEILRVSGDRESRTYAFGHGQDPIHIPFALEAYDAVTLEGLLLDESMGILGLTPGEIFPRDHQFPPPEGEVFRARVDEGEFSGWEAANGGELTRMKLIERGACGRPRLSSVRSLGISGSLGYFVTQVDPALALIGYRGESYFTVDPQLNVRPLRRPDGLGQVFDARADDADLILFAERGGVFGARVREDSLEVELATRAPSLLDLRYGVAWNGEYLALTSDKQVEYFDGSRWALPLYRFAASRTAECGGIARILQRAMAVGGAASVVAELDLQTGRATEWDLAEDSALEICSVAATELGFVLGTSVGTFYLQEAAGERPTPIAGEAPIFPIAETVAFEDGFAYATGAYLGEFDGRAGFCQRFRGPSIGVDAMGRFGSGLLLLFDARGDEPEQLARMELE
ncbi:MAG: hypothetical protein HYV07_30400 [Deltaproteobacteria bacterium]|nr:hypothetical protein [Deltaproteobacteria bacterium]